MAQIIALHESLTNDEPDIAHLISFKVKCRKDGDILEGCYVRSRSPSPSTIDDLVSAFLGAK